jgi:methionine synthase II (cobalamin-independent)
MQEQNKAADLLRGIKDSLRVTGIGSVPFADTNEACELILKFCPRIPYVPQLIKRDPRENMFLQFSENLPCLLADCEKKQVVFDETQDREKRLAEFYDYIVHNCYEYFRISLEYSKGFYLMLEKCRKKNNPFIKVQVTGPVTYLLSVTKKDRQSLIFDNEFSEAITLGLAMKGLWQAQEIRKTGKIPILFFDEPSLWGLGSAYMPVSDEKAAFLIDSLVSFIKERDKELLLGLHCCGNTDWRMIFESGVDIVSFDACSFGDKLVLYPKEIKQFLQSGGFLAFGIVPTSEYKEGITEEELRDKFIFVLEGFEQKGIPRDLLLNNAIFTPACGMGPLAQTDAKRVLKLTASLAKQIQDRYIEF